MSIKPGDITNDKHGPIVCRAVWKNYLICSRSGCEPFLMTAYAWTLISKEVSVAKIYRMASSPSAKRQSLKRYLAKLKA